MHRNLIGRYSRYLCVCLHYASSPAVWGGHSGRHGQQPCCARTVQPAVGSNDPPSAPYHGPTTPRYLRATLLASREPCTDAISGSATDQQTMAYRTRVHRKQCTFAVLSISAYVLPSYSKIGSQPSQARTPNQPVLLPHKERHPYQNDVRNQLTKVSRPSRRHNLTPRASLEENRLLARTSRKGERADCRGGLILVGGKEVVQACVAKGVEEPLAVEGSCSVSGILSSHLLMEMRMTLYGSNRE